MTETTTQLSLKRLFIFWIPLFATWLMMAAEGPFLSALIARLPEPKFNLAAYGVAYAFALIIESPIIMMTSAATALVKGQLSYRRLRNFMFGLNAGIIVLMLMLLLPPIFYRITEGWMELPPTVAQLTHYACLILLPWPVAIGYRRFYQGILITANQTRRVAYGTIIRLATMAATASILYWGYQPDGVVVGAAALAMGVLVEAIASRIMAASAVTVMVQKAEPTEGLRSRTSYRDIGSFYYPLALTSVIALAIHPFVTFFMGQGKAPLESLAAFPVVTSLVFIFRTPGLSFQEVAINFLGENNESYKIIRNFTALLAGGSTLMLMLIAFTPLSDLWYIGLSGLSEELAAFASAPTQILAIIPAFSVLLCLQRALLVNARHTKPITVATMIEVAIIFAVLYVTIVYGGMIGAVAAAIALLVGRLGANSYLLRPYIDILAKTKN